MELFGCNYYLEGGVGLADGCMLQYVGYLRGSNRWWEYEGESVRHVKKATVQRMLALVLVYHRSGSEIQELK